MKTDVLGIKINTEPKRDIIAQIAERLMGNRATFIVTPYSEMLVRAQRNEIFRNILNQADFALPDGIGVLWAAKYVSSIQYQVLWKRIFLLIYSLLSIIVNPNFIKNPISEKISGSDFIWDLAKLAAEKNYSIFLLGGFGDTPQRVGERLKEKFPALKIAGTSSKLSFPRKRESSRPGSRIKSGMTESAIDQINASGADFLFVALGPVRQEKWIYENLPKLRVKLAIGLGGTFDYIARKRALGPDFVRSAGLEWLWRLLTQPWRIRRITKGIVGLIGYCVSFRYNSNHEN